jgi:RNase P subunit RPR2
MRVLAPLKTTFTCEHCGARVPMPTYTGDRDACTECGWSKHVQFGTTTLLPCGAMMRPTFIGGGVVVHRCLGCGFMMRTPTEAEMDKLHAGSAAAFAAFATFTLNRAVDLYPEGDEEVIALPVPNNRYP